MVTKAHTQALRARQANEATLQVQNIYQEDHQRHCLKINLAQITFSHAENIDYKGRDSLLCSYMK